MPNRIASNMPTAATSPNDQRHVAAHAACARPDERQESPRRPLRCLLGIRERSVVRNAKTWSDAHSRKRERSGSRVPRRLGHAKATTGRHTLTQKTAGGTGIPMPPAAVCASGPVRCHACVVRRDAGRHRRHSMDISRKRFVEAMVIRQRGAAVHRLRWRRRLRWHAGGPAPAPSPNSCSPAQISGNHGHALVIAKSDSRFAHPDDLRHPRCRGPYAQRHVQRGAARAAEGRDRGHGYVDDEHSVTSIR